MQSKFINLLRGGVFMLAAVFAFAFTQPVSIMDGYGAERDTNGEIVEWHKISELDPTDYICVGTVYDCIFEEEDVESEVLEPGEFILLNP